MAIVAVGTLAATFVSGDTHPVAMTIIWAVYAVTLMLAMIAVRNDLNDE